MSKRLVSKDPHTGKEVWCHMTNEKGAEFLFETRQPVRKAQENEVNLKGNTQRHTTKIAEIPTGLYQQLRAKFGDPKHNPTDWNRWLNDADNRVFRTNSLRV